MQLSIPSKNLTITKNFPTPTRITDLWKGWYKTCQKLCNEIPGVPETVGYDIARWHSSAPEVDEKWIKYTLVHIYTGERMHLVINRKGAAF
jgi:hypothetical protein